MGDVVPSSLFADPVHEIGLPFFTFSSHNIDTNPDKRQTLINGKELLLFRGIVVEAISPVIKHQI